MAGPCTIAAAIVQSAAGIGHSDCFAGKLDYDIGVTMGNSIARAMVRVARAVCPVTGGTGKARMGRGMAAGNIRECRRGRRVVWPPGCQCVGTGDAVARSATVAGTGFGVASPAIRGRARGNGIYADAAAAIRMATARNATGEGHRPGSRPVD